MEIDKDTVLDFLREQGKDQEATDAEQQLPDQVDTDRDAGLLERFGVDVGSLVERFTGASLRGTSVYAVADSGRPAHSGSVVPAISSGRLERR